MPTQRFAPLSRVGVTGWWLGQSGFVFAGMGGAVALDPFLSADPRRQVPPPAVPEDLAGLDAVLITHEHPDHLDIPCLAAALAADPHLRIVVPSPVADLLEREGFPSHNVQGVQPGQELRLGSKKSIQLWPLPARHGLNFPPVRYDFGLLESGGRYRYLGYVVRLGGVTLYHSGDCVAYEGLCESLRHHQVDAVLLPINGRSPEREAQDVVGNFTEEEAATVACRSGALWTIPMHYEMYAHHAGDPAAFVRAVRRRCPSVACLVPAVGNPFVLPPRREEG